MVAGGRQALVNRDMSTARQRGRSTATTTTAPVIAGAVVMRYVVASDAAG